MVAITVILAAVIGVFVLGLGDELGEAAPNNNLDIEQSENNIDITLSNGDSFDWSDVDLIVEANDETNRSTATALGLNGEMSVGDTNTSENDVLDVDFELDDGDTVEVRLIHTPSDSTMATDEFDYVDPEE